MDSTVHEQIPAGHVARLVANWLEDNNPEKAVRHIAELLLWQWPGIRQTEDVHSGVAGKTQGCIIHQQSAH